MRKLAEMDWFDNSCLKLEFCLFHIEQMKSLQSFTLLDQVMVNVILNTLKHPFDYAAYTMQRTYAKNKVSKRLNTEIPFRLEDSTFDKYYHYFKLKTQIFNKDIAKLYWDMQESRVYEIFNKMQNNEKHSAINIHKVVKTENIPFMRIGGMNISNITMSDVKHPVVVGDKEIDVTQFEGYSSYETLSFEYKDLEVFDFLMEVWQLANNFIIDIKEYMENKENPSSNDQETRQVDE